MLGIGDTQIAEDILTSKAETCSQISRIYRYIVGLEGSLSLRFPSLVIQTVHEGIHVEEFVAMVGVEIAAAGGGRVKLDGRFLRVIVGEVVGGYFSAAGVSEVFRNLVIFIVAI